MQATGGKIVRGSDQFMLRMPEGMREKCKELAGKNRRSLNAELILMIEEKLKSVCGNQNAAQ